MNSWVLGGVAAAVVVFALMLAWLAARVSDLETAFAVPNATRTAAELRSYIRGEVRRLLVEHDVQRERMALSERLATGAASPIDQRNAARALWPHDAGPPPEPRNT